MRIAPCVLGIWLTACGPGVAPGHIEISSDFKVDTVKTEALARKQDLAALRPGVEVEGPPAIAAGVRRYFPASDGDVAIRVVIEEATPEPTGSAGSMHVRVTFRAAWVVPPDHITLEGTLAGDLTYKHDVADLPGTIGTYIGEAIAARIVKDRPAATARPFDWAFLNEQIAVGDSLACTRDEKGAVRCWGDAGQRIGAIPAVVPNLPRAVEIDAGSDRACARADDGAIHCWGAGLTDQRDAAPRRVCDITDAVELAVGGSAGCARLADGSARCWSMTNEPVGDCEPSIPIAGTNGATAIAAGHDDECALLADAT